MRVIALVMLMAGWCLCMQGCNVVAGVTYVLAPDPSEDAVFTLPDRSTVVFVDDRRNVMHPARLRNVVGDAATTMLLEEDVLATMVAPRDAARYVASKDRHGQAVSMAAIGEAVGAEIVIYVEMKAFGLSSDGRTPDPQAACEVRIIDAVSRTRLFPVVDSETGDQPGHLLIVGLRKVNPSRTSDARSARKLAEELATELGDAVAELFFKHNVGRLGENLDRR